MLTVLHSVGECVRHVPVCPYVSGILLVVIFCVGVNVPARTFRHVPLPVAGSALPLSTVSSVRSLADVHLLSPGFPAPVNCQ